MRSEVAVTTALGAGRTLTNINVADDRACPGSGSADPVCVREQGKTKSGNQHTCFGFEVLVGTYSRWQQRYKEDQVGPYNFCSSRAAHWAAETAAGPCWL